jgi:lipopolysaccharide transport system ATP-binding protein
MSEPYIHVDGVWKKFHRGEHHDTLRDLVLSLVRRRAPGTTNGMQADEFWAVRDVSFHVRPGETLGIIGGNGAGKSTLLKLLTRILRPNKGAVRVEGRIGALIEVSAGFHPDLTGRENVYLQGALMGMPRVLIDKHFDEIVEFSGVSEFLDTPVKRYSSGMNARLGFSIAAHLDPDVLIIDEVLAVGDYRFQQRAFERLHALATSGRPVVVVSHQLDRIAALCSKAVLLVAGRVHTAGTPAECIEAYVGLAGLGATADAPVAFDAPTIMPSRAVAVGDPFTFSIPVIFKRPTAEQDIGLGVRVRSMSDNQVLFSTNTRRQQVTVSPTKGTFTLRSALFAHLMPGQYVLDAYAFDLERKMELCSSALAYLEVVGDEQFAIGRANLGGRLTLVEAHAAAEPRPRAALDV